jgi:hypothetical protein
MVWRGSLTKRGFHDGIPIVIAVEDYQRVARLASAFYASRARCRDEGRFLVRCWPISELTTPYPLSEVVPVVCAKIPLR